MSKKKGSHTIEEFLEKGGDVIQKYRDDIKRYEDKSDEDNLTGKGMAVMLDKIGMYKWSFNLFEKFYAFVKECFGWDVDLVDEDERYSRSAEEIYLKDIREYIKDTKGVNVDEFQRELAMKNPFMYRSLGKYAATERMKMFIYFSARLIEAINGITDDLWDMMENELKREDA